MSISDVSEIPKDSKPVILETGPSTFNENSRSDLPLYRTERIIASLTVAWVIILTTYMLLDNNELSYTSVYFLKIILSLSGAVMLATLPGFFDVSYSISGFSVRAAGGAAAFVFIYTQSPNLPVIDKYEKSTAPPIEEQQPHGERSDDKVSILNDEYPVLFVLSVSPVSFAPAFYQHQTLRNSGSSSNSWKSEDWPEHQQTSVGAYFMGGDRGTITAIAGYMWAGFAYAKSALDAVASVARVLVDGVIRTVRSLLDLESVTPSPALNLFTEVWSQRQDLTGSLLNGDDGVAESLFSSVELINSLVLSGIGQTLDNVINLTDRTVDPVIDVVDDTTQELVWTVHGTTDHILYSADRLLGVATGALDNLTGGSLTQPVSKLAHRTVGEVDTLTDVALPATVKTAGAVLHGVHNGMDTITGKLNEISPKIVSRLDPEFAAAAEKSGNGLRRGAAERPSNTLADMPLPELSETAGLIDMPLDNLASGQPLFDALPSNDTSALTKGSTCIAGCDDGRRSRLANGRLGRTVSGLTGMVSGGSNSSPVLGVRIGSGKGGSGLLDGFDNSSPAGGLADNSGPGGGLISSTVKTTGSILGKTLGNLKK